MGALLSRRTVKRPQRSYVHLDYTDKRGAVGLDDLPEPHPGALQNFTQAITRGMATFSEDGAGKYKYPREMWRRQEEGKAPGLVDIFIAHGWAFDKGGKRGIKLTPDGENIIAGLAQHVPPTQ